MLDLADQLLAQGFIVPLAPADEALQGQAGLPKTIGNRFDVFAFDVRQQTTDIGLGMLSGRLGPGRCDKGFHKGVQAWNDLLEKLRGNLTFLPAIGFCERRIVLPWSAPSVTHAFYPITEGDSYTMS